MILTDVIFRTVIFTPMVFSAITCTAVMFTGLIRTGRCCLQYMRDMFSHFIQTLLPACKKIIIHDIHATLTCSFTDFILFLQ